MLPSRIYSDTTYVTRFLKIIARLRQREPKEQIERKLLAQEFGCDPHTIQRDVELLQVDLHLPLTYDRSSKTHMLPQAEEAPFLSFERNWKQAQLEAEVQAIAPRYKEDG